MSHHLVAIVLWHIRPFRSGVQRVQNRISVTPRRAYRGTGTGTDIAANTKAVGQVGLFVQVRHGANAGAPTVAAVADGATQASGIIAAGADVGGDGGGSAVAAAAVKLRLQGMGHPACLVGDHIPHVDPLRIRILQ